MPTMTIDGIKNGHYDKIIFDINADTANFSKAIRQAIVGRREFLNKKKVVYIKKACDNNVWSKSK